MPNHDSWRDRDAETMLADALFDRINDANARISLATSGAAHFHTFAFHGYADCGYVLARAVDYGHRRDHDPDRGHLRAKRAKAPFHHRHCLVRYLRHRGRAPSCFSRALGGAPSAWMRYGPGHILRSEYSGIRLAQRQCHDR
jgi:hypothetical protein